MNRQVLTESMFDGSRLAFVAVVAAIVVVLDVTVLDLVGIESMGEAVSQFIVVTVGAYFGLTMVDVASGMEAAEK